MLKTENQAGKLITAHTRKAKLFRQSESFVSFTKFVSTKAFRSTFLALQVCAKRYVPLASGSATYENRH
jgi:hypothetical protein